MTDTGIAGWQHFHNRGSTSGRRSHWPNETMLRVLFGSSYLRHPPQLPDSSRVLDVGCGFGQNLDPFIERGFDCSGVEIDPAIVDIARKTAIDRGLSTRYELGRNRELPFPSESFDLVLSIDTLHYEHCAADAAAAIREFARVLKPEGALYLTTIGPLHDMYDRSEKRPDGSFKVQNFDFRNGESMFCYITEQALATALGLSFSMVETGRSTQHLMRTNLDWLVAVAQRKRT